MNAKTVSCFECSNCQKIWKTEEYAQKCCLCCECGAPKYFDLPKVLCKRCYENHELDKYLKAPKVPYDGSMVYDDEHSNYFPDLESLQDWICYNGEKTTIRLMACRKIIPQKFEVVDFLEADLEEGLSYDYEAAERLEDHVNKFLEKAQGEVWTYTHKKIDMDTLLPLLDEETRNQVDFPVDPLPVTS